MRRLAAPPKQKRKGPTSSRRSNTNACSRPWLWLAEKSHPRNRNVALIGKILELPVPMNTEPQSRNSLKLALVADTLRRFSEVRFVARGTSMLPAIYPGDCLTVKSFGAAAPRPGDIVLSRRAGEFRVHRIVGILEERPAMFYALRGDALTDDDPLVPASELLGRVTSLVRRGRPFDLNSPDGIRLRFLRSIVRHSKVATVLLLRWHAMQARDFRHSESLPAVSAEARTECI